MQYEAKLTEVTDQRNSYEVQLMEVTEERNAYKEQLSVTESKLFEVSKQRDEMEAQLSQATDQKDASEEKLSVCASKLSEVSKPYETKLSTGTDQRDAIEKKLNSIESMDERSHFKDISSANIVSVLAPTNLLKQMSKKSQASVAKEVHGKEDIIVRVPQNTIFSEEHGRLTFWRMVE